MTLAGRPARSASDRVFLRGLVFFARHGVYAAEAELGQRFEVDVDCMLGPGAVGRSDAHEDTVCYQRVYDAVKAVIEGPRVALIETLAERVAGELLERFPGLRSVRVEVRKPSAPVTGVFTTVGVEVTRHR